MSIFGAAAYSNDWRVTGDRRLELAPLSTPPAIPTTVAASDQFYPG